MRKVKIELPGGQFLFLGLPDGAKIVTPQQQTPTDPSSPKGKETIQSTLLKELKAYCNDDLMEMEKTMRTISEWQGKSKTVSDIPKLSDGRAGASLRNLRGLKKQPKAAESAIDPFGGQDDDIPF